MFSWRSTLRTENRNNSKHEISVCGGITAVYGLTHENEEHTLKTREEMRQRDPMLFEIIIRNFPTDDWSPMDYAPETYE